MAEWQSFGAKAAHLIYHIFSLYFIILQFKIRTGAVKRPFCSNFALLNDHFSISLVV